MSADDTVAVIADLFASEGAAEYLGEPVTQAVHMLQAAMLAEQDRAGDALIAAALLHDVGHFAVTMTGHDLMSGTDTRHGEAGASWLAQWFGAEVTEPVRLHVAAKRYLCATEPDYMAALSPASVYTLACRAGRCRERNWPSSRRTRTRRRRSGCGAGTTRPRIPRPSRPRSATSRTCSGPWPADACRRDRQVR
jgi:predicted HD phosphohydrolase